MAVTEFSLGEHPDWQNAANALVNGLSCLHTAEDRLDLLEHICEGLGPTLYPAFLSILYHIEIAADAATRQLLATALVDCLVSGRLPSGQASAWGSTSSSRTSDFHAPRQLGPIEYLCAWQVQGAQQDRLSTQVFSSMLASLIELTNSDARARSLYLNKLSVDATDPMAGSYSSLTRSGLQALAEAWHQGLAARIVAERFLMNTKPAGLLERAIGGRTLNR